ncbi:MAG: Ldh family oxidoreductase [Bacteroidota bacterium]
MIKVSYPDLVSFCEEVFKKMGCNEKDSSLAAKVLLSADKRGIDSHGVARLSGYCRLWESDRIKTNPKIKIVHETPSTATLDADKALGLVSAPKGMRLAIEKAKNLGSGWVCVKNSNHFGIAGYHSMLALEEGMIGISMTNASPLVAPTFSKERLLGTNPISVAIPALTEPPFVADFATTTTANGKLEILARKNEKIPFGWAQDAHGESSDDPHAVKEGGALLPLGGARENGGHKGYILGSIVDIFSGVFSGSGFGPWAPPFVSFLPMPDTSHGEGLGHFFGAIRTDAFRPKEEFLKEMDYWIKRFRNAEFIDPENPVQIPGDIERITEKERLNSGIPMLENVYEELENLAEKFKILFKIR